jgi:hypothetical protein
MTVTKETLMGEEYHADDAIMVCNLAVEKQVRNANYRHLRKVYKDS